MEKKLWIYSTIIILIANLACRSIETPSQVLISLDPSKKYQTITGWEAESQSGEVECEGFDLYANELFNLAVNDLGINRVRLAIRSGVENPTDYFSLYISGKISVDDWKSHRYEIINDNNNPNQVNQSNYQFTELDGKIEKVIIPLQQRLNARGEKLFVNINYVDFGSSEFEHKLNSEEYAEFVLATYQHIQGKYGWVPDAWEVILEPDTNAAWNGDQIGEAIAAAAQRLEANGFTPVFIAPSTTNMGNAITYFESILQIPGVQPYIKELSYHRYSGVSDSNLKQIADLGTQYNIDTAMLEHIGSGYEDLHQDLLIGNNSAWQQFTLAYCNTDNGGSYYWINNDDPKNPKINLGARTRFLRQYFKFIRSGAVRIAATSGSNDFEPLGFINKNGGYVVVVKANHEGSFNISDLPAGGYGIKYTTSASYNIDLKDVVLKDNQQLSTRIPASGVITIYSKPNAAQTVYAYAPMIQR